MELTPREIDKLVVYQVAELARRRRGRGTKLNISEAQALISEAILEAARDGRTVAECMELGKHVVADSDCMPGVRERITLLQIEATFPDGTKLVTVHQPIAPTGKGAGAPAIGAVETPAGDLPLNEGRPTLRVEVSNTGDRPIQVGSHYHFFETNPALKFDRARTRGFRLDIAAGTAVRFEPGQTRTVDLVAYAGDRIVQGFRGDVMGKLDQKLDPKVNP